MNAQVTIHNVKIVDGGKKRAVLSIKESSFRTYIENILKEANSVFEPKASEKYESFPILKLVDSFDTNEEFIFNSFDDLPKSNVLNSKGDPVLYILPETCSIKVGLNLIAPAKVTVSNAVNEEAQNERN